MTSEPETPAAETVPALPQDLPGPAPEEGAAAVPVSGDAPPEGSPAADEAAAGPGRSPGCPVCGAQVPAGAGFYAGYGTLCADIAACTARLERAHQDASPDYSYSVLLAALAAPGPTVTVPSWDDLRKRGADECGMWAGITDTMIAAGHASDPVRRYRAWYGREPARAAA